MLSSINKRDDNFEWDDAKASQNWRKHNINFEMAREIFKDVFAIEWADHGHAIAEPRFAILGMVEGRLLLVAYTLRNERIRILSARLDEPHERRKYHNENQA